MSVAKPVVHTQSEAQLHRAAARYLSLALGRAAVWSTVGHGAALGATVRDRAVRGARLKAMGVRPGVADIYIAWLGGTLWIELKSARGRQSPDQVEFQKRVEAIGHHYRVAYSLDGVMMALLEAGAPMHGATLGPEEARRVASGGARP